MTTRPGDDHARQTLSAIRYDRRRHAAAHTEDYLYRQLIPYIGNKRKLLPLIGEALLRIDCFGGQFLDAFAGASVVSRLAKLAGYRVLANDWEPYAHILNHAVIQVNRMPAFAALGGVDGALAALNALLGIDGYVATHLCPADDDRPDPLRERMFFTRANGRRIDAIRQRIGEWECDGKLTADERAILLASLTYAVSYVSNTSGVFKAYHHGWGGRTGTALYRIKSHMTLEPPSLHDNGRDNRATRQDAQELAAALTETVDVAYLDPPYNQHPYGSNYHLLNTVVLADEPPLPPQVTPGTKAAIRLDWRTERRSDYNYAATAAEAYRRLLDTLDARWILTSYSSEGIIPLPTLLRLAAGRGALSCLVKPYKRYRVSSQRYSHKPLNAEFILIIDADAAPSQAAANACLAQIQDAETAALRSHRE